MLDKKRSRQAKANKPKNHQPVTSDTSSVSDNEAHKYQTRKTRKPRSSIIRQLTRNLMYDGKGDWMAFRHNSLALAMRKLASEMGRSAGTTFVGA